MRQTTRRRLDCKPLQCAVQETGEVLGYDERWQLVAVFSQGPVDSGTGARPPPVLRERYVHQQMGMRGLGLTQGLDRVVKRERFNDTGGLVDQFYYVQNRRGDVTAILAQDGTPTEYIRYTAYGEALAIDPTFQSVDIDGNGVINADDMSDYLAYYFNYVPGSLSLYQLDINNDGFVNSEDLDDFVTLYFNGNGQLVTQAKPPGGFNLIHGALTGSDGR